MNTPTLIDVPDNVAELLLDEGLRIIPEAFEQIGMDRKFPKTTGDVLTLTVAMGYDCTYRHLTQIVFDDQFEPPTKFSNAYAWQIDDVVRLIRYLDRKRRWLPGFHRSRKTDAELQRDERNAAKGMAMLETLLTHSFEELEDKFAAASDESFRELIRMAHSLKRAGHEPASRYTPTTN